MAGTAPAETSAATPLASHSSWRWPSSPKPVTSVIALGPAARARAAASRLSVVITSSAAAAVAAGTTPRFSAVETTPPPTGFVRNNASPARAVELRTTRSGCTVPVTASPYFGSASSIEWPPTIATPAAAATSEPPRRISWSGIRPRSSTE